MVAQSKVKDAIQIEKTLSELEAGIDMVLNNKFEELEQLVKREPDCYLHLMGLTSLYSVRAAIDLDLEKIKLAKRFAWRGIELTTQRLKSGHSFIFSPNGNDFTEDECMAQLLYSEFNCVYASLCVIEDQSLMGFMRAAYRLRYGWNGFQACLKIYKEKNNWSSDVIKKEFSAAVLMAFGSFEMGISFLPKTFLKLLEFAGFATDAKEGLNQVVKSAFMEGSKFHRLLSNMIIAGDYMFGEYFYGLGEPDHKLLDRSLKLGLKVCTGTYYEPSSQGMISLAEGRLKEAEKWADDVFKMPYVLDGLKYCTSWIRIWLSTMTKDWHSALKYSEYLKDNCNWSRAVFSYMYGCCAWMVLREKPDEKLYHSMLKAFENVPKLKRNFGGKKAFHEKLVVERSKYFNSNPKAILMPHLDLMYLWNQIKLKTDSNIYLESTIDEINSLYEDLKECNSLEVDASCYLVFMKGACYAGLNENAFAIDLFEQVIKKEKQLKHEKHLIPQAYFELGMIYRRTGEKELARKCFKKAKSYSGYLTEVMINFRSNWALSLLDD